MAIKKLPARLQQIHLKSRPVLSICLYGLVASLAAVGFQLAISWLYNLCFNVPSTGSFQRFAWISLAVIVGGFADQRLAAQLALPGGRGQWDSAGQAGLLERVRDAPRRIAWIKFLAGLVSIGGGQSLGREGPTVQIGSNLASSLAGLLGVAKQNLCSASAAGAAAGLAAAFNAPLAAVAFVLEEIIGDLNSRALGSVLLASVIGAFVVHAVIGAQPAFELPERWSTSSRRATCAAGTISRFPRSPTSARFASKTSARRH